MKDKEYVKRLESIVKQMMTPWKDVPFNLIIEKLSGKKVKPFNETLKKNKDLLVLLKKVAARAGKEINALGIESRRSNEVGNYIEPYVRVALDHYGLKPDVPRAPSGKKKASGYPDLIFFYKKTPYYLECKTYNERNIRTTHRSFYFSPSDDFKLVYDAVHFLVSYEMFVAGRTAGKNIYKCKKYKLLSVEKLSIDLKFEFNSDNRRLYSSEYGAKLLAEGNIK